ncbi:hypothetical protein DSM112329_02675 [Paraconexibacter sp. AEG42_29]|uniref:AIM24 family protein n=1 Tax=Paraconexibacter sp. AEG42_29 TaxID=2997339 RepID=A0AAU7AWH0_9ACTN
MASFSLQGSKLLVVDLAGDSVRALTGSMVAYDGEVDFKKQSMGGEGVMGAIKRKATGESLSFMEMKGRGKVYVAINASEVQLVQLQGETLFVEASSLLALDMSLKTGTKFTGLGGGQTGNGVFTTTVDGHGWVAFTADGPPIALRVTNMDSVTVDPQAYVAHMGNLQQDFVQDINFRTIVGQGSGETFQQRFSGEGVVYIQPAERAGFAGDM